VAVLAALAITAVQIFLACACTGAPSLPEGYEKLCNWDTGWYEGIVDYGYYSPAVPTPGDHGNVAFFPGYPLCARLVKWATGLPSDHTMLLTAQLACAGFWTYLLLFFQRWGVPLGAAVTGVLIVASHPAAFFLVAGYSEALFVMTMLGFFYWSSADSRAGLALAALHGFVMTSTRLVGAPLVVVPLLQGLLDSPEGGSAWQRCRRLLPLAGIAAVAGCGVLAYFAYCHFRFGHWDLYMQNAHVGWGAEADYLAIFHAKTYHVRWPWRWVDHGYIAPWWFDRLAVVAVLGIQAILMCLEWGLARSRSDTGWRWRTGLYTAVVLLWYLNVAGRSCLDFSGMIRYAHTMLVLFVMAAAHLVGRVGPPPRRVGIGLVALLGPWVAFGLVTQMVFVWRFAHILWVA
jgi:hypothetical protein